MKKINISVSKVGIRRFFLVACPFILALLVFLTVRYAVHHARFVETYYSTGIYPFIARLFSGLSNLIPFSLWDIFWLITIVLILSGLVFVVFRRMKLYKFVLRLLQFLALLYCFFYLVWGFNYFRPKIESRIGWEKQKEDETVFR